MGLAESKDDKECFSSSWFSKGINDIEYSDILVYAKLSSVDDSDWDDSDDIGSECAESDCDSSSYTSKKQPILWVIMCSNRQSKHKQETFTKQLNHSTPETSVLDGTDEYGFHKLENFYTKSTVEEVLTSKRFGCSYKINSHIRIFNNLVVVFLLIFSCECTSHPVRDLDLYVKLAESCEKYVCSIECLYDVCKSCDHDILIQIERFELGLGCEYIFEDINYLSVFGKTFCGKTKEQMFNLCNGSMAYLNINSSFVKISDKDKKAQIVLKASIENDNQQAFEQNDFKNSTKHTVLTSVVYVLVLCTLLLTLNKKYWNYSSKNVENRYEKEGKPIELKSNSDCFFQNVDMIGNMSNNVKNMYPNFHVKLEYSTVMYANFMPAIADMMLARFSNTNPPSTKEVMSYEMMRLCTFHDYPESGVSTIKLAKSGFYFGGTEDEVECFNCNLMIKNWNSRMIPNIEHKKLSAECDMVLTEGKNCGNISMNPASNTGQLQVPSGDSGYGPSGNNFGQLTQNSNADRPNNIASSSGSNHEKEESRSQNNLVADGSSRSSSSTDGYSNGHPSMVSNHSNQNSTTTKDASNSLASPLTTYSQASSDRSMTNHDGTANRFSSPSQEGATNGVFNPSQDRGATNQETNVYQPTVSTNETNYTSMQTTEQPSIGRFNSGNQGKTNAKYPQLVLKQDRIRTFVDKGWNTPTTGMEPEVLAEAGLFYGGKKDIVRCFHCGIGLQNWQRGDRPEVEHARWSPKCPYIIQNQGINFVNAVMDAVAQKAHRESQQNTVADSGNANQQQPPAATNTTQRPIETDHVRQHVPGQAPPQALHAAPTRQTKSVRNKKKEQAASNEKKTEKKEMAGITTDKELTEYVKDLSIKRKGGLKGGSKSLFVNDPQYKKLLEDNRNLRDRAVCKVCLEDEICMVFMPCGHMVTCENCGKVIKRCAVCRKQITEKIMTHTIDEEKDMLAAS